MSGIDEETAVFIEPVGPFSAVCSMVALDTFTGPPAEERMQDIAWITPRAVAHQKVIETLMAVTTVYPVGFATLFSSMERLHQTLVGNTRLIRDFLEQARDRREYSVKGFVDKSRVAAFLMETEFKAEKEHLDTLSPGKKYLAQMRFRKKVDAGVEKWTKDRCQAFLDDLTENYPRFSSRRVYRETDDSKAEQMVFNLAFLIHHHHRQDFMKAVSRTEAAFLQKGISVKTSGPWPPYSFCDAMAQ